ncbi:hypothetical protein L798_06312 [Zootermopsis nevadensis]|uniref:Uncharacterized protein n=1 Tax=Zootermopsis nevadensis TaxID=136037 RepID=A0A067RU22_ZOONE|nr:hypothetical protein L798_06312 [Zootermopsis nevadensis]
MTALRVGDLNLSGEDDLSSDDADEDFVYGMSVNAQDVALYGEGYANYKARKLNELYGKEDSEHDEEYSQECSSDDQEDPASRFV